MSAIDSFWVSVAWQDDLCVGAHRMFGDNIHQSLPVLRDIDDDYYPRTFSHVHGTRETRFPYPLVRPAGKPRGTSGYEVAQVSLFSVSIPRVNNSDIDTHFFIFQGSCWYLLFFGLFLSGLLQVFACPRVKDEIVDITIISLGYSCCYCCGT